MLVVATFALAYWGPAESGRQWHLLAASVSRRPVVVVADRTEVCENLQEDFFEEVDKDSEKEGEKGSEKLSEVSSTEHYFIGEQTDEQGDSVEQPGEKGHSVEQTGEKGNSVEQPIDKSNSVKEACYQNWQLVAGTFLKGLQVNRSQEITDELVRYFEENPQPRGRVATRKPA